MLIIKKTIAVLVLITLFGGICYLYYDMIPAFGSFIREVQVFAFGLICSLLISLTVFVCISVLGSKEEKK
jgi:hypothetical protein